MIYENVKSIYVIDPRLEIVRTRVRDPVTGEEYDIEREIIYKGSIRMHDERDRLIEPPISMNRPLIVEVEEVPLFLSTKVKGGMFDFTKIDLLELATCEVKDGFITCRKEV